MGLNIRLSEHLFLKVNHKTTKGQSKANKTKHSKDESALPFDKTFLPNWAKQMGIMWSLNCASFSSIHKKIKSTNLNFRS